MTRRRTTDRKASAPPATPGYAEGTNHPAWPGPDPDADKYMNGDPSSWAEDVHPGPYPNTPPPADPGMQEPQGNPATDPAHYFPNGTKAASRQLRAAMTQKAAKCIRIATSMLPKNASVDAIEDQALDLMSLGDRQIQAMLARIGGKDANYTLTPERKADDLLADDMIVEDEDVVVPASKKAEDEEEEEPKKEAKKADDGDEDEDDAEMASKKAAKTKAAKYARLAAYFAKKAADDEEEEVEKEAKKADEDEETEKEAKKASGRRRAAPSGNQNDPAHYNFEGTDLGKNKKASEDEDEDEALLAEMMEEESKKASAAKAAKKDEPFGGKKAPPFEKKDDSEKKEAKKADDEEETASEEEEPAKEAKKADDAEEEKKSEDEETEKKASVNDMLSGMDDDMGMDDVFGEDPMALMDSTDGLSPDEMTAVYGGRFAGKKKAEDESGEEKKSEDEEKKEAKKAALKPQPRVASTGPKTLGSVPSNSRTASAEISDLSKLWESAPDVSKVFGS
jgi:hypothetical protein